MTKESRRKVRAERVDTRCGALAHMTVDEIRERIIGESVNVTCPECGAIHLTREEAEEADMKKISSSARYRKIKAEAEEWNESR
jgi:predicted  nucleic acid-binding Zn-ribbon protein